jgi:hypothetical protein
MKSRIVNHDEYVTFHTQRIFTCSSLPDVAAQIRQCQETLKRFQSDLRNQKVRPGENGEEFSKVLGNVAKSLKGIQEYIIDPQSQRPASTKKQGK